MPSSRDRLSRLVRKPVYWFLPDDSDVLAQLRRQMAITVEGMAAFEAWCGGGSTAAERVRESEHQADEAKLTVRIALRDAFVTPVSPEDLFILSELLDKVLGQAKDTVREAEVMGMSPDEQMAEMAAQLREGVEHLAAAFDAIAPHGGKDGGRTATAAADAATKCARRLEKVYRAAMGGLLEMERSGPLSPADVREVFGRRELYRRMSRIAETLSDVADRVWYVSVKET